ncbi:hypothetical protein [Piscirickettsia salmonis]|uniref:hypothetical protein n=1 Tax=Piscirickettsia salmonis TaxID=1238 RepID=UPI0024C35130|nr:hypothetical protein [Piscirickettsia salmonis]WGZ73366.1 hypothetical protein E3220_17380 [Piscirickettsia salmonis]
MLNLADIYTDYLIAQNKHATATGLADLMPDELSHDQITRLLNKAPQTSKGTVAKSYREFQKGYFLVLATLELSS